MTTPPDVERYYLRLNVKNHLSHGITLKSNLDGIYSSIKLRAKERFPLTIQRRTNDRVTFEAFGTNGEPILINGQNVITLTPRTKAEIVTTFVLHIPDRPGTAIFSINNNFLTNIVHALVNCHASLE